MRHLGKWSAVYSTRRSSASRLRAISLSPTQMPAYAHGSVRRHPSPRRGFLARSSQQHINDNVNLWADRLLGDLEEPHLCRSLATSGPAVRQRAGCDWQPTTRPIPRPGRAVRCPCPSGNRAESDQADSTPSAAGHIQTGLSCGALRLRVAPIRPAAASKASNSA